MFKPRQAAADSQQEFWIETRCLPQATASTFYRKLDETLACLGFAEGVREICRPAYAEAACGGRPGIDSSVIEANASLRELVHRNTEEQYWQYVKRLTAEAGIDPDDTKAVRRFDKRREGRKTSNEEWVNPYDPDAKVGMTKHGACDMIYKPGHITDLDSGAIVAAEVCLGDQGDTEDLAERVLAAGEVLARVCGDPKQEKVLTSLTADEGYFSVGQACCLQGERVRVIIGDPHESRRRRDKQSGIVRQVLSKAKRAVKSKSGKMLLRKRGEHIERSFCHVPDHGKHRRATLRGRRNLSKRQLAAALTYNLSLLMRHLTGFGTAKQWLAGHRTAASGLFDALRAALPAFVMSFERRMSRVGRFSSTPADWRHPAPNFIRGAGILRISTGC